MRGALLHANAVRIGLSPLHSCARCKFGCAPLRGGGSADLTVRASLYYCAALVFGYAIWRYVSARHNLNLNHPLPLNGREILSRGARGLGECFITMRDFGAALARFYCSAQLNVNFAVASKF